MQEERVTSGRPFESVESAHEFVGLLLQAIEETADDVGHRLQRPDRADALPREEAFQLVAYKLERLRSHVATSRRLLSDLRTLRRILQGESAPTPAVT